MKLQQHPIPKVSCVNCSYVCSCNIDRSLGCLNPRGPSENVSEYTYCKLFKSNLDGERLISQL